MYYSMISIRCYYIVSIYFLCHVSFLHNIKNPLKMGVRNVIHSLAIRDQSHKLFMPFAQLLRSFLLAQKSGVSHE